MIEDHIHDQFHASFNEEIGIKAHGNTSLLLSEPWDSIL